MANPLLGFINRSRDVLTAAYGAGKKKFEEGAPEEPEVDAITASYMDLEQNQAEIDRNLEQEGFESNPQREARLAKAENLAQRQMLRGRITEAFGRGLSKEDLDKEIGILRGESANLDIDPTAFGREVEKDQTALRERQRQARRRAAFVRRANDPNRTLGVGQKRRVYTRKDRLKLAKQLRKDGFSKAAEQVALDYARSPEASAPAISTPAMRQRRMADRAEADEVRQMNQGLTRLLIQKTEQQLRDPDFKLNLNI
tara:strand:- start:17658 stop:18425 length:768 start_codon:yes stop_codon:yes gene_type:complete